MNRPFYAFGVLLTLLALAMYAVGSSSRSTTVESQPSASGGTLLSPRPRLGSIYVVVLPAGEEPEHDSHASATTAAVCSTKPKHEPAPELTSVQVAPAEYDAAAVAVPLDANPTQGGQLLTPDGCACNIGPGEDWLSLFHELVPPQPARHSLWRLLANKLRAWVELPIVRGIQNAALREVQRLGWLAESTPATLTIDWSEYSDLMDSIAANNADRPPTSEPALAVRSSDWMLHFAVSSLSQLRQSLQRAAAELQRLQFGSCDPQGNERHGAGD